VYIVEHGDDASEEDYSAVGNMLLGAINQGVREYGYDIHFYNAHKYYRFVTSEYADPLVAQLADGALVAAMSMTRSGPGRWRTTRRPTPQEHARWVGLPVPPASPPTPDPEPDLIDIVWARLDDTQALPLAATW
jgi:hypothetical protein